MEFFAMLLERNKEANDMIIRPQYMNTLKTYRDVPLVKILAGIRRCGKSTILDMLRYDLHGKSVLKTQGKFYLADTSLK